MEKKNGQKEEEKSELYSSSFPRGETKRLERTGIDVDSRLVRALYRKLILARSTAGYV